MADDLTSKDVTRGYGAEWVLLRCKECARFLLRVRPPTVGKSDVETVCSRCGTKIVWTVEKGRKPVYKIIQGRV